MAKKVLLFSHDPGGANSVAPLFKPLINKGYEVELYGKSYALLRYTRLGLSGMDIDEEIPLVDERSIERFLKSKKADFIITGTSANDFTEKYIWRLAKKLGIPSLAILDQWLNYGIRFSDYGLAESNKYERSKKHIYFPSKIAVMDEYAKLEMIQEGIDSSLIKVTGQPYFEFLKKNLSKDESVKKRNLLFSGNVDFLITFASDGILQAYRETDNSKHYLGYTEKTIFKELVDALQTIKIDKKIGIVIRPHPKESLDNYCDLICLLKEKKIGFAVDKSLDSWDLIKMSELVCGMSSMFLIESVMLGKPIISIQIGLNQKSPFILDRRSVLKSVLNKETLVKVLKKVIVDNNLPRYNFEVINSPIKNIVDHVERCLC